MSNTICFAKSFVMGGSLRVCLNIVPFIFNLFGPTQSFNTDTVRTSLDTKIDTTSFTNYLGRHSIFSIRQNSLGMTSCVTVSYLSTDAEF